MRDRPRMAANNNSNDKMLLPQKYQIPARPLRRRTCRKPVPHSQRIRTMR